MKDKELDIGGDDASSYKDLLDNLSNRIRQAQIRAVVAVNAELVMLYWSVGNEILQRQSSDGWGTKVIERLAKDLRSRFSEMQGLSVRNLKYMRAFAEAWPDEAIVQQVVAQIPWGHNVRLIEQVKSREERLWYAQAAIENGWSRSILQLQIEGGLYRRQGKALTNFNKTLPPPQSDLAAALLKDPYNFDFLTLSEKAHERDLEKGLVDHVRQFILELGLGFAFVGSQYPLEVAGEDFRLDLLFYHLKLRCFVVIDLKMKDFKPEYAGKMNFYLSAVDDQLRHSSDQPSIGIILCKSKKRLIVEYALRDTSKPIGVSEFRLLDALPDNLKGSLPTIADLEAGLEDSTEEEGERPSASGTSDRQPSMMPDV